MKVLGRFLLLSALLMAGAGEALSHSAERGFVLLLPTTHVIAGGSLAVAISFAVATLIGGRGLLGTMRSTRPIATVPRAYAVVASLASLGALCLLVWAGFAGSRDPLENPLPLAVWTLWWVILVLMLPAFGNLWAAFNPFTGLLHLLGARPLARFPQWLSHVPAFFIFLAFAWFQLVYPGPEDPRTLAIAVLVYALPTFAAALAFGSANWLSKGDPFAIFFRLVGAVAAIRWQNSKLELQLPGAGLLRVGPLPWAGICFVLLTLSSVSFDGFANTFLWLSTIGVNPLDFPGRSAVMAANTAGLVGFFFALLILYMTATAAGWLWAGQPMALSLIAGRLVLSLIPISIAFHFAHYLGDLLVNGQYLLLAVNDPFGNGLDLLGLGHRHVTASFLNTAHGALAIFSLQTAAIVAGHVVGVLTGHLMLMDLGLSGVRLLRLEAPVALLMVAYTGFGLWTLAAPAIG